MACNPIEPVEHMLLCVLGFFKKMVYIGALIWKNEYKEN